MVFVFDLYIKSGKCGFLHKLEAKARKMTSSYKREASNTPTNSIFQSILVSFIGTKQ